MPRGIRPLAALAVCTIWIATAAATTEEPSEPTVLRTRIDRPPDTVLRKSRFDPEAHPSPAEVHRIAELERARWGGPSIIGRIDCETGGTFNWAATNGQYRGLLQIGPVWGYLYEGAPRKVRTRERGHVRRAVRRITLYSDGHRERDLLRMKRVDLIHTRVGRLPSGADPYHGWAAIRVGQLAVAGGRTTSWDCGL